VRKFRDLVPFDRLYILTDSRFLATIPQIPGDTIHQAAAEGIEVIPVPVDESAVEVLERLPVDAGAAYITPMLRMPLSEQRNLIEGLTARDVATFSLMGEIEVELGVMASLRTQADIRQIARRVALNLQRILMGEDAGTLPIELEQPQRLTINMETARAIGVHPRWKILTEAKLVHDIERESGPELTIELAVGKAITANLSLLALDRRIRAGEENISLARSAFLPRAEAFVRGTRIDADRAEASFGSQAERTATGGLSISQLLYSDGARADLSIARSLQESLVRERETARLDIALAAAQAYLDVLRAETLERVEQDNVRLTESNLELAERRERIGYAGSADVYRWQAELATARSDLIAAQNRTRAARVVLNELLNRPLEEPFTTVPPALDGSGAVVCCDHLVPYVDNREGFRIFREFSVNEGLANSPELKGFDSAIAAQERTLSAARRSYWAPEIALVADAGRDLYLGGAGADVPIFTADRNDWSVTLQGTLPLFQGGSRRARADQARADLSRLRFERDSLVKSLELRIRAALFEAGTTFPAIELAQEAAAAARKNLELVTDSYSRGLLSIIDLLDAQNSARAAEEFAANAQYDFLLDLMEIQRATNSFDFFLSEPARQAWYQRLERFYSEAGYRIRIPRGGKP
jgi:outer membrane protein TolC